MNHRLHIHKKASSQSAATPVSNLLQPRPFAVPETVTPQETPDLQQQQEREKPRGMNLLEIPNLVAESSPLAEPPQGLGLQAKLTIGEPGDRYEQEADRVAADVVQRIHAPSPQVQREEIESVGDEPMQMSPLGSNRLVQREKIESVGDEQIRMSPLGQQWRNAVVQREEIETVGEEQINMSPLVQQWRNAVVQREDVQEEEQVRMKPQVSFLQREEMQELNLKSHIPNSQSEGMPASPDLEASIQGARGGGQPLGDEIREPMEQAFGADFSGVRVHTDGKSDQLNQSIQAKAFTTGQDVFFRSGAYDPGSRGGQELLAHELTHVVQQSGGAVQDLSRKESSQLEKVANLKEKAQSSEERSKTAEVLSARKIRSKLRGENQVQGEWITKDKGNLDELIELVKIAIEKKPDVKDGKREELQNNFLSLTSTKTPMLLEKWVEQNLKASLNEVKENKWKKKKRKSKEDKKESKSKRSKKAEEDLMDTEVVEKGEGKTGGETTTSLPGPVKPTANWAVAIEYSEDGEGERDWSKENVSSGKVKSVNIPNDRPPGTSGEKEGGHLTAWAVMRSQVAQKVYPEIEVDQAIQGMCELIEHYQMLPGHGREEHYKKEQLKNIYQTARNELLDLLPWKDKVHENQKREFLRTLVERYLRARNAMPLAAVATTENTGGGESRANERLWDFEKNEEISQQALYADKQTYCAGLLWIMYDAGAAATWANQEEGYNWEVLSQNDEEELSTTPKEQDEDPSTWKSYHRRIIETIVQHIMSVEQAYPKAAEAAKLTKAPALKVLMDWFSQPESVKMGVGVITKTGSKWEDNFPLHDENELEKRVQVVRGKADKGEYKPKKKSEDSKK